MPTVLDPFQFVLIAVAGWMNRRPSNCLCCAPGAAQQRFCPQLRRRVPQSPRSIIQQPVAETPLIRGKMPSVTGVRSFRPRSTLASCGAAKLCVATNSPDAVSSRFSLIRTAIWAWTSFLDHALFPSTPALVPDINKMYFVSFARCFSRHVHYRSRNCRVVLDLLPSKIFK